VALGDIGRTERLAAPLACPVVDQPEVAPTVRVQRSCAVRAHDPEVLEPVVGRDSVDVIEDQSHSKTTPEFALAAQLASALLDACRVEPALQAATGIGRSLDQDLLERRDLPPSERLSLHEPGIEVIDRYPPQLDVLLEREVVPPGRSHAKPAEGFGIREGLGYRASRVSFRVSGT
jgi:hypothetical protein